MKKYRLLFSLIILIIGLFVYNIKTRLCRSTFTFQLLWDSQVGWGQCAGWNDHIGPHQ